jgi:hypothetical protein
VDPTATYKAEISPTASATSNEPPTPVFTGTEIIRQLEKRTGSLSMEEVMDIGLKTLETLRNATRKTRIAWYSDYRRALKKARRINQPVEIPEVPSL